MDKKLKELMKIAKSFLPKEKFLKLKKIEEVSERLEAVQYSLARALEQKYREIEVTVSNLPKGTSSDLIINTKLLMIPPKIKNFEVEYDKGEFYKVLKLFSDIEEEVKHVAV